jgi:hypothetical protein
MKRLAILLLAVIPTRGADTPIVTVIGATEFEIPATEPTAVLEVLPPISLLIANDLKPEEKNGTSIRAKVLSVSVGTAAHPEYGKAFEFGSVAAGNKGALRELSVAVHLTDIPDPQTYLVKVLIFRDGDPSVPPQTLDFKFIRGPATLSVSPLRIENTRLLPFCGINNLSPNQLKFQETSGRASLTNVQVQVKDFLKGPDDSSLRAQLQVPVVDKIEAGKDSTATVSIQGDIPLGSTKGTLVVHSRQLSQSIEVPIEILTRTNRVWLMLALIISILLGYFLRTRLDQRRVENQGRLAAEQEFGQIAEWKVKCTDADLAARLGDILTTLKAAIEAKPFDATKLDTATKKAATDSETEIKKAEDQRNTLRSRISALRDKFGSPLGQPKEISTFVDSHVTRLQDQERELNRGAVKSVQDELDKIEAEFQNDLPTTIRTWAEVIHQAASKMGQWSGLEFEDARKSIFDETNSANASKLDLAKTRDLARDAQISLLLAGVQQTTDLANQVVKQLEALKLPDLAPLLGACREKVAAAEGLPKGETGQVASVAEAIANLRSALKDVITKAAAFKSIVKLDGLDEGDFAKAVNKLLDSFIQEKAFGGGPKRQPEAVTIAPSSLSSSILSSVIPQSRESWWDVQLNVPSSPLAGGLITTNATVVGKNPPGTVSFEWRIGDEAPRSGAEVQFAPSNAGVLAISVRAVDTVTGEERRTSTNIRVRAQHGSDSVTVLASQLEKDEGIQTAVSGVFIAAVGYAIFQGNWYGTFLDFLAATLWGFSIDFSVAKVREIATPLLGRAVPFTDSK